jgi:hypothetical protein
VPSLLAIAVVVAVAVLSSPLVPSVTQAESSPTTAVGASASVTTTTTAPPAAAPGSALLVVQQDGKLVMAALLCAGPKGAVVLGLPGVTLLRSGDGFVVLADAFSASDPATLSGPITEAFGVPTSAVAAVEWSGLKGSLAGSAVGSRLPDTLDARGSDAGPVAAVLATALRGAAAGQAASAGWWRADLTGQEEAFQAAVAAEMRAVGGSPWTGQVLEGQMVDSGNGTSYLEPDIQKAREILQATGVAAAAAAANGSPTGG